MREVSKIGRKSDYVIRGRPQAYHKNLLPKPKISPVKSFIFCNRTLLKKWNFIELLQSSRKKAKESLHRLI